MVLIAPTSLTSRSFFRASREQHGTSVTRSLHGDGGLIVQWASMKHSWFGIGWVFDMIYLSMLYTQCFIMIYLRGLHSMSLFGDFEHHLQIFVGDCIPNGGVMFNWDIYQPLWLSIYPFWCTIYISIEWHFFWIYLSKDAEFSTWLHRFISTSSNWI